MAFDWFRRKHTQQSTEPPETETEAAPSPTQESPAVAETPASPSEDYLNWAKAAYQTIQKRQQNQASPQEIGSSIPEGSALDSSSSPISEPVPPAPPDLAEPETIAAPPLEVSTTSEPTSAATPPTELEAPPEPTPSLPFWAQSQTDRLERLERLREAAIVEPVVAGPRPEPAAETTTPIATDLDLALDEGFLWSAEVLAAQGRRPDDISIEEITWLKRLRQGLDKTRRGLVNQLRAIVGQGPLNQDAVVEIEAALLQADVGVEATDAIIEALQDKLRTEVLPPDAAITYLKQILQDMLDAPLKNEASRFFAPQKDILNIWLITGVNGAGKTTTIGKLAHIAQKSGYNCLIAAADTFRAAAVEQVKVWGSRSGVEVIANPGQNTDPAAVVFDAIAAARSRKTELLLVDTAGRLQNKKNLMDELSKVRRIIDKKADDAVVESLLVLDATLGQNGLRQAEVFSQAAQLSGVVLTKLDGTAKGGIALAIVQQLGLPIRFIGAGEGIEDLRPFSSYEFVEALLSG